jgi:hypothetical protein
MGSKEKEGMFETLKSGSRVDSIHPDAVNLRTNSKVIKPFFFVTYALDQGTLTEKEGSVQLTSSLRLVVL